MIQKASYNNAACIWEILRFKKMLLEVDIWLFYAIPMKEIITYCFEGGGHFAFFS